MPESLVCAPEELPARFVSTALEAFRAIIGNGERENDKEALDRRIRIEEETQEEKKAETASQTDQEMLLERLANPDAECRLFR